jgi:hypothetical protein
MFSRIFGLLRNSTKIAAQFLGLGQCSQKAPENAGKHKLRPDGSQAPHPHQPYQSAWIQDKISEIALDGRLAPGTPPEKIRPRLAKPPNTELSASTVRVPIFAQQKWSSCAAAVFGGVAVTLSGGVPGASRWVKHLWKQRCSCGPIGRGALPKPVRQARAAAYPSNFLTSFSMAEGLSIGA